jgi:hypothetical protein
MSSLKTFITILLIALCISTSDAQEGEVGFGIGGLTYTGELERGYNFLNNRPAATVFYRVNLNEGLALKFPITFGLLRDSDNNPTDPFASQRNASMNIFLMEGSLQFEYNFLKFRDNIYQRWSPYFFGGIGLFLFSGEGERTTQYSNIQVALPFGMGIKYIMNPRWVVGVEFGFRKTFFDYLDNISEGDPTLKNYQYGNQLENDWYYFLGITLSYTFYKIYCPYPNW